MFFYKLISYVLHPLLFSFLGTFLYLYLSPEHMVKQQEYIILLILIACVVIVIVKAFGATVSEKYGAANQKIIDDVNINP